MKKTILLADDSPTIRKVVELTFCDTDIHVESVASGDEAVACFERLQPDLVLADVVMPGPDGYELCRKVKHSTHRVPVLLLAGTFETFDEDHASSCGADGHLRKPFESRVLVQQVRELLQHPATSAPAPAPSVTEEQSESVEPLEEEPEPEEPEEPEELEALVREVTVRLCEERIREVVDEVVPRLAERIVRERIAELERDED